MPLYNQKDYKRKFEEDDYRVDAGYRHADRRDLDRLIHSTCFRRLQGKTQLYPGLESDFFRNRLTHSLEVAQIAKSIAAKVNYEHAKALQGEKISLDIVEFAGLAHDLGHPPFGHQGEEMLDELMRKYGGYEGNAQTLRILTKIEKKGFGTPIDAFSAGQDQRMGLNLTARTLASVFKYDEEIKFDRSKSQKVKIKPQKGYYSFDSDLIDWVKQSTGGNATGSTYKSVECRIMDIADDIAYSTYDLEDALKAGFYTLQDVFFAPEKLRRKIANDITIRPHNKQSFKLETGDVGQVLQELISEILPLKNVKLTPVGIDQTNFAIANYFREVFNEYSIDGYARSYLTSSIVNNFIEGIRFEYDRKYPAQSVVYLEEETLTRVEVLKKFTFISQVLSSRLRVAEVRGKEIVAEIFRTLSNEQKKGYQLLPEDFRNAYEAVNVKSQKMRIICDYIAGMTDRYAIEFYGRLKSESPETIFKPL